jgi:hypothetical protein
MRGIRVLFLSTGYEDQIAMKQRELLEKNLNDLRSLVESQQRMIQTVLDGGTLETQCQWNDCRHRQKLFCLLTETVQVLDETRKAFKSKPLEQLRVRLMHTLGEEAGEIATKAGCR